MLSSSELAEYQELIEFTLVHKYTRTKRVAGDDDTWNMANDEDDNTTVDVSCNYVSSGQQIQKPNGTVIKYDDPNIAVSMSDTLDVGDKVTNIKDSNDTVLLTGPLYVRTIDYAMGFGPAMLKIATLEAVRPNAW